jgi:hypothetical protein
MLMIVFKPQDSLWERALRQGFIFAKSLGIGEVFGQHKAKLTCKSPEGKASAAAGNDAARRHDELVKKVEDVGAECERKESSADSLTVSG